MDLKYYNNFRKEFEELVFQRVVSDEFSDFNQVKIYIQIIDIFISKNLNFSDTDINVPDLFKRYIGLYSKSQSFKNIANDLNKQIFRIQDLYFRSIKKLRHPLKQKQLIKLFEKNNINLF